MSDSAAPTASDGPADTPRYPVEWEADVVLRDGSTTHVRPIRPEDADALQRFHMGQSERSVYLRFFSAMERLSDRDLRRFTHVDHRDRVALVAVAANPDAPGTPDADEIIAVARFDRTAPHEAEVAFNISDAHQGRGLGSVLLEHVAAAARERGIERFTADVLPQNGKMLAVFREAGYELTQRVDDGVVLVSVDLDPTERSRAVMIDRERRAEARSMQAILTARDVLLLTSPAHGPGSVERMLAEQVLAGMVADPGDAYVDVVGLPDAVDVPGTVRTHAALADVEGPVEIAVVALAPDALLAALPALARLGVRALVILSGGYAEAGAAGVERQRELVRRAHTAGMRVVGPTSYGLLRQEPGHRVSLVASGEPVEAGPVGLFCQSAPTAVTLLRTVARRGIGLSTFVSAGHRADVSGNDVMQFWTEDPTTTVACLYLESIGNPRKFSRVARRLAAAKPVVVVAAGQSGAFAPAGHAVRRGRAPRRVLEEIMRQAGVIRAENTHALVDVAQLLAHQPLPAGRRVGIVGSSPGLVSVVADVAESAGLVVAEARSVARQDAGPDEIRATLDAVYADGACDVVVAVYVPTVPLELGWLAQDLAARATASGRPTVVSALGYHGVTDAFTCVDDDGVPHRVPAYSTPEDAVAAVAAVVRYRQWRDTDHGTHVAFDDLDRDRARAIVEQTVDGPLDVARLAELLGCYGVPVAATVGVSDVASAQHAAATLGYPVAVKATPPALRHRADLGGVRLDVRSPDELAAAVESLRGTILDKLGPGAFDEVAVPFEVQRMATAGVACTIRTTEDPLYGPLVSFGLTGDAVDLLGDVAYGVPPLTDADVAAMVRRVRAAPRLFGYRGAPAADTAAVEDLLARVSVLADDLPELFSLELDTVAAPRGVTVLAARATVARARRTDALRRALGATVG
ncbi:GNAT family N-acetyltransferase [Luteimicrobium subarcticum]|uniref:Acyl-CoA synthetase (NDP forming) n=1 Tax=Luteimicrobium subarcticum TaxID=620910 RepID=A0A2M8W456_9MICO|nr:GNAT family N-acetyltransferase [Luteimicrobium subarcticum]PJI85714.1 acyl-CoA synthetase (NDP forming) [Luteimicrobium subarcticum]